MTYNLDFSKNLLLAAMIAISSILSLIMLTNSVLAAPDKFGIDERYRTVNDGPTWFLDNKDPQEDDNFLMTSAKTSSSVMSVVSSGFSSTEYMFNIAYSTHRIARS